MGGRSEDRGLPVGDRAGHGGAYGVRGSAWELNPRAWQRVRRRRCAALVHSREVNGNSVCCAAMPALARLAKSAAGLCGGTAFDSF